MSKRKPDYAVIFLFSYRWGEGGSGGGDGDICKKVLIDICVSVW